MTDHIYKWSPVRSAAGRLCDYAVLMMHGAASDRPFWQERAERDLREAARAMGFTLASATMAPNLQAIVRAVENVGHAQAYADAEAWALAAEKLVSLAAAELQAANAAVFAEGGVA